MGEDFNLPVSYIKHRGFFDANALFGAIQKWFAEELYELHLNEFKQKPGTLGSDYRYIVKADRKVTEFAKFHIELWVRCFNMKDVELIQDGKKIDSPSTEISGIPVSQGIDKEYCKALHGVFNERNLFEEVGGYERHNEMLRQPMVMAFSIFDDVCCFHHGAICDSSIPLN